MFKKITIIGTGNMGSILASNALEFFNGAEVVGCDKSQERLNAMRDRFPNLNTAVSSEEAVAEAGCLFLAVKPQDFFAFAEEVKGKVSENILVVSIMAGIDSNQIKEKLGVTKVIRTMPNTPMMLQKGVIGWLASPSVGSEEKEEINNFFSRMGVTLECFSEDEINKVTAVSGSGPAYFFYTVECLIEAAKSLGFAEEKAKKLVIGTLSGATKMMENNDDIVALRQQVTSKGGTTHAALTILEDSEMKALWQRALDVAYKRAQELAT